MKHSDFSLYISVTQSLPLCLALFQQYGIGFLILFYGVCSVRAWLTASKHITSGKIMASRLTPNCCWVGRLMPQLFSLSPPDSLKHSHCHLVSLSSLSFLTPGRHLSVRRKKYSILTDMSVHLPCLPDITFVFGSVFI